MERRSHAGGNVKPPPDPVRRQRASRKNVLRRFRESEFANSLDPQQTTRSIILVNVADAQSDVDANIARYSEEQLTCGTIAPDVARRLLDVGRVEEAFGIVERARAADGSKSLRMLHDDLDEVYEERLESLGMGHDLKDHLWNQSQQNLSGRNLRQYQKLLANFEDIEAEESRRAPHDSSAMWHS